MYPWQEQELHLHWVGFGFSTSWIFILIYSILFKNDFCKKECGEKQSQIERAIREKRAVEEELEKVRQLFVFLHHI